MEQDCGMNRRRDRSSATGLLPRMEARPWADGVTVTYRYHPVDAAPINLGTDRNAAIQKVLDMLGTSDDRGTVSRLFEQYKETADWKSLTDRTRADYTDYSVPLLAVFGGMRAADITAPMISRYLRVERAAAPVRANREIALLGNLIGVAIDRGEAEHNPCRGGQVRRNKERPRTRSPERAEIDALVAHAYTKGPQWRIIVMAAEFAALAGSRQAEFLTLHWPAFGTDVVRLRRAKQRGGAIKVEVISVSPALLALRERLQDVAHEKTLGTVFPNRKGNPYTASGFAAMWGKLMREAIAKKVIETRFTFHDLRAHYTTVHKVTHDALPDLHANPSTTATIYERSKVSKRKSL